MNKSKRIATISLAVLLGLGNSIASMAESEGVTEENMVVSEEAAAPLCDTEALGAQEATVTETAMPELFFDGSIEEVSTAKEQSESVPEVTSSLPAETESVPAETESVPAETESVPAETESVPVDTGASLEQSDTGSADTSALQETTGNAGVENSSSQEQMESAAAGNSNQDDEPLISDMETINPKETREEWERTMQDVMLGEDFSENLLAIARTQLGYQESLTDYIVDEYGNQTGYTRYAAWEGLEYGEWNAMFVDFCLNYAQIPIEALPSDIDLIKWKELLGERYLDADAGYMPEPGDLIFFHRTPEEETENEKEKEPDRIGIVSEVQEEPYRVSVIEGDVDGMVCEIDYDWADSQIVAYVSMTQAEEDFQKLLHPEMGNETEDTLSEEGESEAEEVLSEEGESEPEEVLSEEGESETEEVLSEEGESEAEEVLSEEEESEAEEVLSEEGESETEEVLSEEPESEPEEALSEEAESESEEPVSETELPGGLLLPKDTQEAPETEENDSTMYDVNKSMKVDINDVQWMFGMLQKYEAGELEEEEALEYDLNQDLIFSKEDIDCLTAHLNEVGSYYINVELLPVSENGNFAEGEPLQEVVTEVQEAATEVKGEAAEVQEAATEVQEAATEVQEVSAEVQDVAVDEQELLNGTQDAAVEVPDLMDEIQDAVTTSAGGIKEP